jgi:hypothetical protein
MLNIISISRFTSHITSLHILLSQLTIGSLLFYLLFVKNITPFYYSIFAILLSLFPIISIKRLTTKTILLHSFVLFISLRLIYFFATQFKVIPQSDPYWDLAVIKIFISENKVAPINKPLIPVPAEILSQYSSWPLLHLIEMINIMISNVDLYLFHMLFPLLASSILFIFIYLIIKEVASRLKLSLKLMYFTLLLVAVDPTNIYFTTISIRQLMGLFFFTIIIFLLIRLQTYKDKAIIVLLFIMLSSIVYAHHWSTATLILTLAGLIALKSVYTKMHTTLFLVCVLSTVIWWTTYGQIISETPFFRSSFPFRFNLYENLKLTSYPTELTPSWAVILLNIRNILLYIPSLIGCYLLYKKYTNNEVSLLVVMLFVITIITGLLNLISSGGEFVRVFMLFGTIIAIMTSYTYFRLFNYIRINENYMFVIFVFIGIVSFFGLWGNSYILLHLYDKSIDDLMIGEHNYRISSSQLILINEMISNLTGINRIVTDNIHPLIVYGKPAIYNKVVPFLYTIPTKEHNNIIVSFDNLYIYKYFYGLHFQRHYIGIEPTERILIKDMLNERLDTFNRIYSDSLGVRMWS